MSDLIDAKLIIEEKKNKKGFITQIEINGQKKPFSRHSFTDNSLNGKPCQVDKRLSKIIVEGKTYPEQKSTKQNNQLRQTNRQQQEHYSQGRSQSHQTHSYNQANNRGEEEMPDSVDINKTKLPKDTKDIGFKDIDNFALKLNKVARFDDSDNKFKFYKTAKKRGEEEYCIKENFGDLKFEDLKTKMSTIKTSLESQGYKITEAISMKPDWRLIIGLGNESVYETSMTLHHIYGIPYIPGSAIKGVTRSYVITTQFNSKETIALEDKQFVEIFGDQEHQGKVIFFEAFPTETPKIEPDIMNCHYDKYYQGSKTPPADYLSPNPIFFLTVKDATFEFYLGMKAKHYNEDKDLFGKAKDWLEKALTTHGIGAKTSVGYGYFN